MQWGHIKTLFILSFFLLNIYLLIQFIDKQQEADLGVLDSQESSFEEQLAADDITIENIETDIEEAAYLSVPQREISREDIDQLNNTDGITSTVIDDEFIVSEFEESVSISEDASWEEINNQVKEYILYPEEYELWDWDQETNVLLFFQKKNDRTIYFNQYGLVLVYLNDENEMTHYTQTILSEEQQHDEMNSVIQPMTAIEALFDNNYLNPGDVINDVRLGYYSRIVSGGTQVFAPSWKVTLNNGERNYFVNAIEGLRYAIDDTEFVQRISGESADEIRSMDGENENLNSLIDTLMPRIDTSNRSEGENDFSF